ncbi:uncharacterized protein HKW66_Vig0106260 [Vigna angularis]|uniref:Uncharacterized protein n=1 Tax=Phaseolus angularis TaxID=3914 RepID=A0A8T0KVF6_PHAAN|nr:uncharacterized protein HKW66_Vig0106260 [Vigna angularis]
MRKRGGGGGGWATERKRYLLYKDGWCTVGDAGDGDREEANAEKRLLRVWQGRRYVAGTKLETNAVMVSSQLEVRFSVCCTWKCGYAVAVVGNASLA